MTQHIILSPNVKETCTFLGKLLMFSVCRGITSDSIMVLKQAQIPSGRGQEVGEGGVYLETSSHTERIEDFSQPARRDSGEGVCVWGRRDSGEGVWGRRGEDKN